MRTLARVEERWPDYQAFAFQGWPPGHYLGHLAYAARLFTGEARKIAEGRDAEIGYFDEGDRDRALRLHRPRSYAQLAAALARQQAELLALAARVPEEAWTRALDHPRIGPRLRPRGLVKFIARHEREHREELERLLEGPQPNVR